MADTKTVQFGFRVPPEKAALLDALSRAIDRRRSWLLEQALDRYPDPRRGRSRMSGKAWPTPMRDAWFRMSASANG